VVSTESSLRRSVTIADKDRRYKGSTLHGDVSENSESTVTDTPNISNRYSKKDHIKKSFLRVISEFEKKFVYPEVSQQNDPLYDKLKAYHGDLLRSISNTTTDTTTT